MRLKQITPGMAIRCKNDDERKALLEEAEKLGYRWNGGYKISEYENHRTGYTIHFYSPSISTNYNHITWSDDTDGVTEFSDLILPELTAEEVLEICHKICGEAKGHCASCRLKKCCYRDKNIDYSETLDILKQWKSEHEKKEPEIETVDICRIIEIQQDGRKRCVHEETIEKPITLEVEETLKRYCMEHEGEFIAVHEVVSMVKR